MSYRILVVDDSPVTRRMVKRTLTMSGLPLAAVEEAGDGRAALEVLGRCWIDLVMADINMPVMNGMELVEKMKQDALLSTVPVVVLSTERAEPRIAALKAMGVRAYLTKPFTPEAVAGAIQDILGKEPGDA